MEGIYFILRVPYVGVASWSPERRLWYQIDTFQEPLDRGYVTYWAYLTDTGEDLTRLIKAGMSFPQLPPWYSHMALAREARREALQVSSLYGVPLDAVTNPALYTDPFVGGAYRRLINERLHAMLLDTAYAELDLCAALFALDAAVQWQSTPPSVARSALLDGPLFDAVASFLFGGGPSWIQANLSIRPAGVSVIDMAIGQRIGNPRPAINVSWKAREILIIDG